ncbi:unnamed protein product, partial [Mesocestoides corti]
MPWAVPIKPTSTYQHGVVTLQNPTRHEIEDGRPYTPHRLNQAMFSGQLFVSDNQSSDLVRKKPVHVEQVKVEAEKLSPIRVAQKSANHQPLNVVTFSVVIAIIITSETDAVAPCRLIGSQFSPSNARWHDFVLRIAANVSILTNVEVLKQLCYVLKTNLPACKCLGHS